MKRDQAPDQTPRLSDLVHKPTNRRVFLARASALGVALPGLGAALAACSKTAPSGEGAAEHAPAAGATTGTATGTPAQPAEQPQPHLPPNPDSRLDTALKHGTHPSSATPASTIGAADVPFHRYDPALPPLTPGAVKHIHMTAREVPVRIRPETVVAAWTFDGDIPGPIVHVRQGDTVEFTLTNQGTLPHSMDFHAAQIDPKVAFRSVPPGQSVSYTFRPKYAGAFLYHCGTSPVLMHLGSGMFGAIIVDPLTPLAPAKEFVLVQSEFYLSEAKGGIAAFDYSRMLSSEPDLTAFNGRPSQYSDAPIHVKRGDRVRFYVVVAGPTQSCGFHVVGEQFETVYLGAPPGSAIHGVQTFSVTAGGGMIFELVADVPGEFVFVNHSFGHGQKGAMGTLVVEA
ncbi:MAG: multicopper oxidase domain-containing protein [Gemmatimonadaceae bacterium]